MLGVQKCLAHVLTYQPSGIFSSDVQIRDFLMERPKRRDARYVHEELDTPHFTSAHSYLLDAWSVLRFGGREF